MNENNCHKEIIKEICIYLNNCANCYDEELHCTKCDSLNCTKFQISKTTKDCFYMEIYSDDINYDLIRIADRNGYKAQFTTENGERMIKFEK